MASEATIPGLNEEQRVAFDRDGITVLRGVFAPWVEALREGVETNKREPGPYMRSYTAADKPGHFFGDDCNGQRIAQYESFVRESPAAALAARLMRSRTARFFHEHVLVKETGSTEPTPWHHDQPYCSVNGEQNVSFWIPLDNVADDVCPQFIAGSHRWGRWFVPQRFTGEQYSRPQDGFETIPDIEAERDRYDIKHWALEPGDALAFHFLTVHGAPVNASQTRRRRGFSARWVGDDATWAVRSGDQTSPPFPKLHEILKHGDALDVPQFPVL
ncbi:MAG: ectoine hydroxylase-related dioxygenase (phytanoyl-CoA dioxygenase family) [Gammaproteobacteria bacterium]|jgi:ectoine hydroxylase-related dioxygenase (phytanoyl-CoA dioxygenase family)